MSNGGGKVSAMDDPREILKAAGVECAEVDVWSKNESVAGWSDQTSEDACAAILALARLVAKYKYEADGRLDDELDGVNDV